jgi:hypothetical protein
MWPPITSRGGIDLMRRSDFEAAKNPRERCIA